MMYCISVCVLICIIFIYILHIYIATAQGATLNLRTQLTRLNPVDHHRRDDDDDYYYFYFYFLLHFFSSIPFQYKTHSHECKTQETFGSGDDNYWACSIKD